MLPVDGINTSAPTQDTDENLAIAHQAESAAAKFLFDLESGELNADVAAKLSPHEIYMGCTLASSLSFVTNGKTYSVVPYYAGMSDEVALELLEDVKASIESELLIYQEHKRVD